jgi:hypothetical protein
MHGTHIAVSVVTREMRAAKSPSLELFNEITLLI